LGYAPGSVQNQTQLIARFAQWLWRRQTEIHCIDETLVQSFSRSQQNPSSVSRSDTATLHRFLYVLRQQGVVPLQKKTPLSSKQRLINNYQQYLLEERGLTKATVVNSVGFINQFLSAKFRKGQLRLSRLVSHIPRSVFQRIPTASKQSFGTLGSSSRTLPRRGWLQSLVWRQQWEKTTDTSIQQVLITFSSARTGEPSHPISDWQGHIGESYQKNCRDYLRSLCGRLLRRNAMPSRSKK
jgi:hypothetical protein